MALPSSKRKVRSTLNRDTGESAANTQLTVSTTLAEIVRVLFVTVKYSAAVTQNVTITLKSGKGTSWDTLLQTIALSGASDGVFIPDEVLYIEADDNIDVVAPAGGAGVTSAIAIYTEIPW